MQVVRVESARMARVSPHLSPVAVRFLQQLKRNNDRDWFLARKDLYTHELQEPWLAIVEAVNHRFLDFAPEYARPAKKAALRIYRDVRFSKDKRPYRQWALSVTLPLEVATSPKLLDEIVKRFSAAAPMVALLNAPLLAMRPMRKSMF